MSHLCKLTENVTVKLKQEEDLEEYKRLRNTNNKARFLLLDWMSGPCIFNLDGRDVYFIYEEQVTESKYNSYMQKKSIEAWK